jgi:8-oxo-dGTP pyrophosphatase MutT (NUDIX family)
LGRQSVTPDIWLELIASKKCQAVRPKINGEKFVVVKGLKFHTLKGFKEINVPLNFFPQILEYYAGTYYCVYPFISKELHYTLEDGSVLSVHPHTFMRPREMYARRAEFTTHKYDGFMIWTGNNEYRVKWNPTVDVLIADQLWEVALNGTELYKIRPRYGKAPSSVLTAQGRIHAQMLGKHILPRLTEMGLEDLSAITAVQASNDLDSRPHHIGSKCFFVDEEGGLSLIRELAKPLDFIGGVVEKNETPEMCIVREVMEETGVKMDPLSFFYVCQSDDESDTALWSTHIFLAVTPPQFRNCKNVERFTFKKLEWFEHSSLGRPRAIWTSRLMKAMATHFPTWESMWLLCYHLWPNPKGMIKAVTQPSTLPHFFRRYGDRLLEKYYLYRQEIGKTSQKISFESWLFARGFWCSQALLDKIDIESRKKFFDLPSTREEAHFMLKEIYKKRDRMSRQDIKFALRMGGLDISESTFHTLFAQFIEWAILAPAQSNTFQLV